VFNTILYQTVVVGVYPVVDPGYADWDCVYALCVFENRSSNSSSVAFKCYRPCKAFTSISMSIEAPLKGMVLAPVFISVVLILLSSIGFELLCESGDRGDDLYCLSWCSGL